MGGSELRRCTMNWESERWMRQDVEEHPELYAALADADEGVEE